ncbi:carbohydrate ABC transporter permease [Xylanivirga thermophila]|jgi:putative aldouronate transport system permease protein|uniref:carbohydrate ABC transporter permease n=1 Tax=Xylanivirga thermophila TaxID=2496273 RepID=UPI00101CA221|nr:carbohydrate ABC transporter permease [Xylanivirga thermophila]
MAKIRSSKEDIIFDIINYIILAVALIVTLYPLYFIVIASISDPVAINNGKVWLRPVGVTFEGYRRIFKDEMIWTGYKNTILYTLVGTAINVMLTMMIAYPLSRKNFSGRRFLTIFLVITMYFNGGLIPTYIVVKNLGLVNNWWVMVLLGAVSTYNVIICRTFLQANIPEELYEAAAIDGCSHFNFFIKHVLPLSKAIIAVLALYYGIAHWNEFMKGLIYLRDEKLYPLQLILRAILIENQARDQMMDDVQYTMEKQQVGELIKYGIIIVASLPVLIIYPFLQKYFVKGVMVGSIKG